LARPGREESRVRGILTPELLILYSLIFADALSRSVVGVSLPLYLRELGSSAEAYGALLPAVAQVQVGDLVYTVRAYLPDEMLAEFLDLLVPEEGCTIEVFRPEVLEVPGEPIKPDEIPRIMGEGVRLPAYLPEGLTLRGALVESLSGKERKTILIVYADHPCRFYSVPAPWLPDAPNLTIWVDRLPGGHATFPTSVREIALGTVTVYVWPEVPLNPTRVEFWVGDLFYSVQGYYPLDEILRVAESIIVGGG